MEIKKYKSISFDLDTKEMAKHFKSVPKGYEDLKKSFKRHGFNHRQGSGYVSLEKIQNKDLIKIIEEIVKENPWLKDCVKHFDVANIEIQSFDMVGQILKTEIYEQSSASSEVAVTQEPTTSTAEVKPNGVDVPKKKDFVEIEPRQIYGEKDGKYLLKSDADSQGNKKQFLVPKQSVKLDKDGKVSSVSANVQNRCKFTRKQAKNIKNRTK